MRCYGCGSNEGTESALCPQCRAKRTGLFNRTIREKVIINNKLDKKFVFQVYKDLVVRGFIGLLVLGLISGVYNYFDSKIFPFLVPTEQKVLTKCLNLAAFQLEQKIRGEAGMRSADSIRKFQAIQTFLTSLKNSEEATAKVEALRNGDGKACDDLWNICKEQDMKGECSTLSGKI